MSIKSTSKPTLVKVVIPIYRNLNDEETASLNNTMEIFGQHPIYSPKVIKPIIFFQNTQKQKLSE